MRFLNAGAQQRPMALVLAATLAALAGVARAAEGDPPATPPTPPAGAPPAAPAPVRDSVPPAGPTVLIPAPAGASDEVLRANVLIASGHPGEARALLELRVQEHPEDIPARQILLSARVAEMEQQIRELLAEESKNPDPALDVDYQDARARADKAVVKRMEIAEYYAAERRYPDAVVTLNAILRDYPHEPAVLKLKFRLLKTMIEIERTELLKDKRTRHDDAINDVIDDARIPGELPKSKRQVFVFDEDIAAVEREALRKKLQTRLDLIFDGTGGTKPATVREVLQPLFAVAGVNYVILDSALGTETLTIHLVNETVETALATISKLVNIRYNYAAGTVFISNAASDVLVTRIIRVQSGLTDVVTDPKLEDMTAGGGGGGGGAGGAGGYGPQGQGQGGAANLFAQQQQQQQGQGANTPATSDLERFLDKVPDLVVGWPADGKIYLDRKSNTIYVRATPSAIDEVERLLYALDYNNVQVLIEARFIEVSDDAQKELGIDWAGGAANTAGTGFISSPTTGLSVPSPTDGGAVINNGAAAAGATGGLLAQVLVAPSDYFKFKATLAALQSKGKTDTLSEPKILTLNNAVGIIEVRQDISYISGYENVGYNQNVAQTGNINIPNNNNIIQNSGQLVPQFTKDFEGIHLQIRPSVARNSDIVTLSISPTVRELTQAPQPIAFNNASGTGGVVQNQIERPPQFDTRRLVTALHIRNGGTVVLGGLAREKDTSTVAGVPGLSDIPVLGRLFRHESKSTTRRNLMIFVTAHIVNPQGQKEGEEVQRLRDTARVLLPGQIDKAEKNSAAEAAKPDPEAEKPVDAGPVWRRDRRR